MATAYTNYTSAILSQLKSLIQAEFPGLKTRQRYIERPYPKVSDFGPEFSIRVKLLSDTILEQYSDGRLDEYLIELTYSQKQATDTNYTELTNAAERMKAMLADNLELSGKWHYLTQNVNYDPDNIQKPADYEGRIDGWIMTIRAIETNF